MSFTLWIPGRLPGLNELLNQKATIAGKWNGYAALKCRWFGQIKLLVLAKGIGMQSPGFASGLWIEPHRQRDPDNILAGGFKLLLDAFVGCEVLQGDGWGNNLGMIGHWECRKDRAGCLFHWGDELMSKASLLELLEKEEGNGTAINGRGTAGNEPSGATARKATRGHARPRRALGGR